MLSEDSRFVVVVLLNKKKSSNLECKHLRLSCCGDEYVIGSSSYRLNDLLFFTNSSWAAQCLSRLALGSRGSERFRGDVPVVSVVAIVFPFILTLFWLGLITIRLSDTFSGWACVMFFVSELHLDRRPSHGKSSKNQIDRVVSGIAYSVLTMLRKHALSAEGVVRWIVLDAVADSFT